VAARIAGWSEECATAVQLHTTAEAQLEEIGLVLYEDDRTESDALLDSARSNLGDEAYQDARRHIPPLPDAIQMADEVLASAEQLV
jgi:hypothetical protein